MIQIPIAHTIRLLPCISIAVFACAFVACSENRTKVDSHSAKHPKPAEVTKESRVPPQVPAGQENAVDRPADYEVAVEAINQWSKRRLRLDTMPDKLILLPTTCEVPPCIFEYTEKKDSLHELNELFKAANSNMRPWSAALNPIPRHQLVEESMLAKLLHDGDWPAVEAAWPGARFVVDVSRPGIRADGNVAIIYIGYGTRRWSGAGALLLLSKGADAKWTTEEIVGLNY